MNVQLEMNEKRQHRFAGRSAGFAVVGLMALLLASVLFGCMSMEMEGSASAPASKAQGSMTAVSEAGLFRISIQSEVDPIPINTTHAWRLHVENMNGQAVGDASITVDGGMPAHGHGLPTVPQVTEYLGNGDYRVEGLRFHMQGRWVVNFAISAGGGEDTATLELQL